MTTAEPAAHSQLSPFRIEPDFNTRIWGYRDLRPWYNHVAEGDPVGEVWLTGDANLVATGPHAGKRLGELFAEAHTALMGPLAPSPASPLLIKVILAKEKLSVQVHPDDAMAQKCGDPCGKTECWYALAAEQGAQLALGLKPGVTAGQIRSGILNGTLEESLNLIPVSAGEMIFVDAGTVHAIWPGSILLEAQQNCDLTYRMYDYGRPRELHIEKSLEATKLNTRAGKVAPQALADRTILIDREYFRIERIPVSGSRASSTLPAADEAVSGLAYLFATAGSARIAGPSFEPFELPERGIVAVPATSPVFSVEDLGELDLLRILPRWPGKPA